jgi:hypothetical protein
VMVEKDRDVILIDPFFSHQSAAKIGKSVFAGRTGKAVFKTDKPTLKAGLGTIHKAGNGTPNVLAIINAHSHYDHLMDIPAVYESFRREPVLLMSRSAYNIVHQTVDTSRTVILENFYSTRTKAASPIVIYRKSGSIHVYPILSQHNPHYRNIKFFSGEQARPLPDFVSPFGKTKANLWLEGNTYSFLIDYVTEENTIDFRMFIQSSSCNAPWGIPPETILKRPVDVAFIGVVSYAFSPGYPCELLSALEPRQIVWVHWEDFFRKYGRKPKTVRGTNLPGFFSLPCVMPIKNSGKLLWPGVKMKLVY